MIAGIILIASAVGITAINTNKTNKSAGPAIGSPTTTNKSGASSQFTQTNSLITSTSKTQSIVLSNSSSKYYFQTPAGYPTCTSNFSTTITASSKQNGEILNSTSPDYVSTEATFFDSGLYWVFLSNQEGTLYTTSPDGSSWSDLKEIDQIGSVYFDGAHLDFAYSNATEIYYGQSDLTLCYRVAEPLSNGTLAWLTPVNSIYNTTYVNGNGGFFGVSLQIVSMEDDYSGHLWILAETIASYDHTRYTEYNLIKSSSTNGSFVMDSSFPLDVGRGYSGGYYGYWNGGVMQSFIAPTGTKQMALITCGEPTLSSNGAISSFNSYIRVWNGNSSDNQNTSLPIFCGQDPPNAQNSSAVAHSESGSILHTLSSANEVDIFYSLDTCTGSYCSISAVSNLSNIVFSYISGNVAQQKIAKLDYITTQATLFATSNSLVALWTNGSDVYSSKRNSNGYWSAASLFLAEQDGIVEGLQVSYSDPHLAILYVASSNPNPTVQLVKYRVQSL